MRDDHIIIHATTWEFMPQFRPGIATNQDGRLLVTDGTETLILPAPATFIYEEAQARAAVKALQSR